MFLGILGVGHLATTIVAGLVQAGFSEKNMILSPRGKAELLSVRYGIEIARDNKELVQRADMVLLCVRPQDAVAATRGLPWRDDQTIISVCAGVTIGQFSGCAARIVRAMPLTAAEIGASPTACFPAQTGAVELLQLLGPVISLPSEADFETATVNAAVYGWVQDLIRLSTEWAVEHGLDANTARRLTAHTFIAAGRLINEKPQPITQLLGELVTPGGITELGLDVLARHRQPQAWREASDAVRARLLRS